MNASRVGLLVMPLLVAVLVRPAASDSCREEDLDAQGKCPKPPPPPPTQPPAKPTQLDIRGAAITGIQVSLDGQPAGHAPLIVPTTPGRHLVEVQRDSYMPYAEWVEVKKGEWKLVQVTLRPVAAAPASQPTVAKPGSCLTGMVRVPPGTFQMGSPEGVGDANERPQHPVTLPGYCIDKTEVTVKAYGVCVAAKGCSATSRADLKDIAFASYCNRADRSDHPANCVDWNQAAAYCKWADKRLPTEAAWEYAARGGDGRMYPWGNEAPSAKRLNACGTECVAMQKRDQGGDHTPMYHANDGWETTAPVGSFPDGKSPFGALDMAGNVWEWTADLYGNYSEAAATNPKGAKTGTRRVFRGGSWDFTSADFVRAANRNWGAEPSNRSYNLGFRCARGD